LVSALKSSCGERAVVNADIRWVKIAQTHFQQGLMAARRAVLKPESF